jgi:phosphoenolpyruvate synthase/pyruvate phosphate dikinase
MVSRYAKQGPEVFNCDVDDVKNTLEGNKPGTVIYSYEDGGEKHEFPPRWYDMYLLLKAKEEKPEYYLRLMLAERDGTASAKQLAELASVRRQFHEEIISYVEANPLPDNDELVTPLTDRQYTDDEISHKGRMLVELTQNCYPVPDFVILTAECYKHPEHLKERLKQAIHYLEVMTNLRLGDNRHPLVFAIRCAMPQYIPGLMPTLLNIGVNRTAYEALAHSKYGEAMANRVYLSTLHTIAEMLGIENKYEVSDIALTPELQRERIALMEAEISAKDDGALLLSDAFFQAWRLVEHVRKFYIDNHDLILTFMQGKQASPSLILQRMVWTIGNEESYPGVLYSRHSRTGKGSQIESYRNIFGEEIMTGDVTSDDRAYTHRESIKHEFPAVYHFHPLLTKLEERYRSPVTIEFAVESRPDSLSLFSVLQLNMSEMTGRAALISAIDLLREGRIEKQNVVDIIKPYHLRQIVSNSIDERSFGRLTVFGSGLSVLPRTAITAVLCFSAGKAREMVAKGQQVCLCQERFVPEDTIVLNEVHAILSMTPAAIHVVTACRGYGIPALMNLHNYGIRMEMRDRQWALVNGEGDELHELDTITISSYHQTIYRGVADFRPARFAKFLKGEQVPLADDEVGFFNDMKSSYETYQQIVTSQKASVIDDVDKLARIIRLELQDKPDIAREVVNRWYSDHSDLYVHQVLQSRMGSHQDQSRVFDLLDDSRKVHFFQKVSQTCIGQGLSGLKAGSFMIGRFVSKPMPTAVWNRLTDKQVAFLLNEYVLYEKYQQVLEEVGEIRLVRAHSRIETEGIDNMVINNFELHKFIPLHLATHDWASVAVALEEIEHQDNTHILVEKLSRPTDQVYDLSQQWVREEFEKARKEGRR